MARKSTEERTSKVLEIIKNNPGIQAYQILDEIADGSTRSQVDRSVSHLKTMGLIEDAGGYGYRAKES